MGLPVLNTQMPSFFCRGVELRRGAQRDLLALDRKIERVAWGEAQLVPERLGKDDAARSIEDDFAAHKLYYKKRAPIWGMVFRKKPNRFKVMRPGSLLVLDHGRRSSACLIRAQARPDCAEFDPRGRQAIISQTPRVPHP